jgi:hypothetical protein
MEKRPETSPNKMITASTIKIKDNRSTYPGGKGGAGVYQSIINLIPPHDVYIETHLGGGSVMRQKRPAAVNIGIDLDPEVISSWRSSIDRKEVEDLTVINADAARWLTSYRYRFFGKEFVYADPPYLMETRKGGKLYDFEYTLQDHIDLINVLKTLPCMVMISGYWSSLYSKMLPGWNTHHFDAQTRKGTATEWLWFNYPKPEALHDYSFLGSTFRQRERIKKKRDRWISRLLRTPALERNAIIEGLLDCLPEFSSPETVGVDGSAWGSFMNRG